MKENSIKSLFNKYKKVIFFSLLLFISIGISIFFVSAQGNDDNKYTVTDIKITSVVDGTPGFDENSTEAGNDSSNDNGIVRNFDSITYDVSYLLKLKDGQVAEESGRRTIIIDVLIPNKIEGKINGIPLANIFGNYSYAELETSVDVTDRSISLVLSDINTQNNTNIKPKIYIRESTDNETISIEDIPSDKRGSISDATSSTLFRDVTTTCNENVICETRVTAKEDYVVKVFGGSFRKEDLITRYNIGYMVGMSIDPNKGIKGKYMPSNVEFNINSVSKINGETTDKNVITYSNNVSQIISNDLYMCDNCTGKLETISIDSDNQNGVLDNYSQNNGNLTIRLTGIKGVNVPLSSNDYVAFSTGELILTSERTNEDIKSDISIELSSGTNSNTLSLVDKQNRYVGVYSSSIDLYDKNSTTPKTSGLAIINYGDSFIIDNNINYAKTGGDDLDSLTSYIKVDNNAINLNYFEDGDSGSTSMNAALNIGSTRIVPEEDDKTFYYGEWSTEYFERTENADNYGCPSDISSPETLMNLYGGPCIKATSRLKHHNTLIVDADTAASTDIPEALYTKGPLIVKVTFRSSNENKIVDCSGKVRLAGTIKNNTSLINTTHQIVSSATAEFTNTEDETISPYYLSNEKNVQGTYLLTNPRNYNKTVYDFVNKNITSSHNNICNSELCAIAGNTIIVSAARTQIPSISTSYNSSSKSSFYYYPIEWNIETSATTSAKTTSLNDLTVDVYLPNYLTLTASEYITDKNQDGIVGQNAVSIEPTSTETVNPSDIDSIKNPEDTNTTVPYIKYTYQFDLNDFNNIAPQLRLYTNIKLNTPNSYMCYGYAVVNYGTRTNVIGQDSIVTQTRFETIEPIRDKSNSTMVTLHNDAKITTQGSLNPRYLEKNETYTYKMQAYNNSNDDISDVALYYVLPYKGDSAYDELQSKFDATGYKIKLSELPAGYKAYYNTGGVSANIISNELDSSNTNSWVEWTNPTTETTEITAIKIVKTGSLASKTNFVGEEGITVYVTPIDSNVGDIYYNQFYIITGTSSKNSYPSSRDRVSIYNRTISGFIWEDFNYDGLSNNDESKLENIPVSLFKISDDLENIDANDPSTFVGKDGEEWVSDTTTDSNGRYTFNELTEGRYYAKFTYDDKKYNVTKRDATNSDNTSATSINSKARSYSGGNVAISSIVVFDKLNNSSYDSLNLGLSIRKEFAVDVKNYIKNVTITSDNGTESHDYDKQTMVSITLKNTRNKTARVTYDFVVENTKYFPGYIGLISDVMPDGMTFNSNLKENQDWVYSGGILYYTGLSGKLLVPNEKYYFQLVLDFDIKEGGNYINFVSLDNLVLMGDEVPEFDFTVVDTSTSQNTGEGE